MTCLLLIVLATSSIASSADSIVQPVETEADVLLHIKLQNKRTKAGNVDEIIERYRNTIGAS